MEEQWEFARNEIAHKICRLMWGNATPERVLLVIGWMKSEGIIDLLQVITKGEPQA